MEHCVPVKINYPQQYMDESQIPNFREREASHKEYTQDDTVHIKFGKKENQRICPSGIHT